MASKQIDLWVHQPGTIISQSVPMLNSRKCCLAVLDRVNLLAIANTFRGVRGLHFMLPTSHAILSYLQIYILCVPVLLLVNFLIKGRACADLDQQQVQDLCNFAWGFGKAFGNVAAATPSLGGRVDAQIDFFMRLKPVRQKVQIFLLPPF